jgi:GNAT superfamily N-acetyltransferase
VDPAQGTQKFVAHPSVPRGGRSAWLEELYVVPDERNRGVGAAMLAAVLEEVAAAGAAAVDLEVEALHARAAHLYQRAGFAPLARARWVRPLARQGGGNSER